MLTPHTHLDVSRRRPRKARRVATLCGAALLSTFAAGIGGCDDAGGSAPPVSAFHAAVPRGFVRHQSRGGDVVIRTPPGWKETSTSGAVVMYLHTTQKASSVNAVVVPAAAGETLDKTMAGLPDVLRHEFADFRLIKGEIIFLKDIPAGRLVYEASRNGFHGKVMEVVVTRGGKHYFLTYTADPEHFDAEAPVFDQVIASMELK